MTATTPASVPEQTAAPRPTGEIGELHLHRILVAIDGSANAELALSAAVTAARRDHATVTLLCVAPDLVAEATRWPGAPVAAGGQAEVDASAQRLLRDAVARMPADLSVTTIFRRGRAGCTIVAVAEEGDYDAIIVGARGVGRVAALLGSVSHHVLHHAKTAVFVAHAPRGGE